MLVILGPTWHLYRIVAFTRPFSLLALTCVVLALGYCRLVPDGVSDYRMLVLPLFRTSKSTLPWPRRGGLVDTVIDFGYTEYQAWTEV